MNANELADELDNMLKAVGLTNNRIPIMLRQLQEKLNKYELRHEEQRKRIDELEAYQKHDVELAEAISEASKDDQDIIRDYIEQKDWAKLGQKLYVMSYDYMEKFAEDKAQQEVSNGL